MIGIALSSSSRCCIHTEIATAYVLGRLSCLCFTRSSDMVCCWMERGGGMAHEPSLKRRPPLAVLLAVKMEGQPDLASLKKQAPLLRPKHACGLAYQRGSSAGWMDAGISVACKGSQCLTRRAQKHRKIGRRVAAPEHETGRRNRLPGTKQESNAIKLGCQRAQSCIPESAGRERGRLGKSCHASHAQHSVP